MMTLQEFLLQDSVVSRIYNNFARVEILEYDLRKGNLAKASLGGSSVQDLNKFIVLVLDIYPDELPKPVFEFTNEVDLMICSLEDNLDND